jgi:hypothetical protein
VVVSRFFSMINWAFLFMNFISVCRLGHLGIDKEGSILDV